MKNQPTPPTFKFLFKYFVYVSIATFTLNLSGQVYVDADAIGAGNGSDWNNAYTELKTALLNHPTSEIWVAEGTYYPTTCNPCDNTERLKTFEVPPGVRLYGGFSGPGSSLASRNWKLFPTILSGDIGVPLDSIDNSFRVMIAVNSVATTLIDGFIIEDGNADGSSLNGTPFFAGGLYLDAKNTGTAHIRIYNTIFQNNFAGGGGAIVIDCGIGGFCEAIFDNCTFEGNTASTGNVSSTGGAILMLGNSGVINPQIINSKFINNYVGNDGGVIAMATFGATSILSTTIDSCSFINNKSSDRGGAIWYRTFHGVSSVVIKNSYFEGNQSGGQGGAIFARSSFDAVGNDTIVNCVFTQNIADGTSSVNEGEGGALFLRGSQSSIRNHEVINCIFDRNFAENRGGAISTLSFFNDADGTINTHITNGSFHGNRTPGDGGAIHSEGSLGINTMQISNSIFWEDDASGNGNEFWKNGAATIDISFSDVQDGIPSGIIDGGNNLQVNPQFIDVLNGNLRISECSFLVNKGNNATLLPISDPDPDGNPRINEMDVDLGAYETLLVCPLIPTLSQWATIGLFLLMAIVGLVISKQTKPVFLK